jgi:ribose transport system permease protein
MPTSGYLSREAIARFQSLIALTLMAVAMSFLSDRFLTFDNGANILRQISVNVCLSLGMTLVILAGGIDLSVGSVLALAGAITAGLLRNGLQLDSFNVLVEFTVFGALAAGMLAGLGMGMFNGLMITVFRIPPFVATLGMMSIARGLTMLWTHGHPITGLGEGFGYLGTGIWRGVPMPVWIAAALAGVFIVVAQRTRFGRSIYAIGGNEEAARLSGLRVDRIKLAVYSLAGLLSAVAGLIVTARLDSAQPNAGLGYELDSIAAVVIGGTSLSGGRGTILGTVLGCLIIGVLNNGLFLLNVSPFWQQVVKGVVILAAVAIDKMNVRHE